MNDRPPPWSARHPRVAELRRLGRRRAARAEAGALLVEGPTLIGEALAAGASVREVVIGEGAGEDLWRLAERAEAAGAAVIPVRDSVVARVATTETPPPVVAVVATPVGRLDDIIARGSPAPIVVLVGVADPGNAGTIVRSAAAAGARGVVFVGGVDPTNPKVVRASAGAWFRLPLVAETGPAIELLERIRAAGIDLVGALVSGGEAPEALALDQPVALVAGNEVHGLDRTVTGMLDRAVSVPMAAGTESLNVAMATTVVLFEAARQRRAGVGAVDLSGSTSTGQGGA